MQSKDCNQPGIPATRWYRSLAAAGLYRPDVHGPAGYWLQVQGSFTQALKQRCRHSFRVQVCREGFSRPSPEEAQTLGLANRQLAWIREVRLIGDGHPWVLARTVIPLNCFEGRGRQLRHLGNKPLGAFLFSSPEWRRGDLETGLCQPLHNRQPRLARRSLFYRGTSALMVCEYLLPELYQ
ncbi:chorismate lyase [Marinobacter nauticus]